MSRTFQASIDGARFTAEPSTWHGDRQTGHVTHRITLEIETDESGAVVAIFDGFAMPEGSTVTVGGKKVERPIRRNLIESMDASAQARFMGRVR